MNTKLTIRFAWDTPYGYGPTWETLEEAEDQDRRDAGETLYKLFINPSGKIVHAEVIT